MKPDLKKEAIHDERARLISELEYLRDLRGLRENTAFRRYINSHARAIDYLVDKLLTEDVTNQAAIAKLQSEILARRAIIGEVENCNESIFLLEQKLNSLSIKTQETKITPPRSTNGRGTKKAKGSV